MSDSNAATLRVYEDHWERYIATTSRTNVLAPWYQWIEAAFSKAPSAGVLEIGGGPGWDAAFLEGAGAQVTRTDATAAFVRYQQDQGHPAILYNILTDPIEELGSGFGMVFAGAVLHHFNDAEATCALGKMASVLMPGGILAFSQRRGDGHGWPTGRLGVSRYFCYRQPWVLWQLTDPHCTVQEMQYWASPGPDHPWIMVTAVKEEQD